MFDALVGHVTTTSAEFYGNNGSSLTLVAPFSTALPGLPTTGDVAQTFSIVDIDGDGLLDVFVSDTNGNGANTIDYFKNTGSASAPSFTDKATNLGLILPEGSYAYPTFVDINADGLYDVFVGNENGDIFFFKNIGTRAAPQFAAPVKNPFGITPVPVGPAVPAFMDIDADGDFDLFVGDGNGDVWFYRNTNL